MEIKAKINNWGLIKAFVQQGNYKQGEKTAFRMRENNSKPSNWQIINLKNIHTPDAAQYQKIKWPNQKIGQITKQTFFQRRHANGLQTWKYAQHHSLSEKCKSKPLWDTISHQSEWLRSKSLQVINAGEGVEKREPSSTVGGNAN